MATALNVAQTSYSYGDAMLLMRASELTRVRIIAYLVDLFSLKYSGWFWQYSWFFVIIKFALLCIPEN